MLSPAPVLHAWGRGSSSLGQDQGLCTWHRPPFSGWRKHRSETRQPRGILLAGPPAGPVGPPHIPPPPPPKPHSHFRLGSGVFSTYCTGPWALSPLWLSSSCCSTSCQAGDRGQRVRPGPAASAPRGPPEPPPHLRRRSGRSPRGPPCSTPRAPRRAAAAPAAACRSLC